MLTRVVKTRSWCIFSFRFWLLISPLTAVVRVQHWVDEHLPFKRIKYRCKLQSLTLLSGLMYLQTFLPVFCTPGKNAPCATWHSRTAGKCCWLYKLWDFCLPPTCPRTSLERRQGKGEGEEEKSNKDGRRGARLSRTLCQSFPIMLT